MLITKRFEIFMVFPKDWLKMKLGFGRYTFEPCECGCTLSWGHGFIFGFFGYCVHERWLPDDVIKAWRDGGQLVIPRATEEINC